MSERVLDVFLIPAGRVGYPVAFGRRVPQAILQVVQATGTSFSVACAPFEHAAGVSFEILPC